MIVKATHEPIRNIITIGSGIIEDAITSNEKCNIRISNRNYSLFALHREDDFWKEISIMEKIDFFCIDFLGTVCNKNEKEDSPLSWDDQKLNNEITLLLDTIQNSAIWGKTRLVMLDARFPYQKTMDNCIFNIPDANYIAKVNSFLEKCFDLVVTKQKNVLIIPDAKIYLGDSAWDLNHPNLYVPEYLKYISSFFDVIEASESERHKCFHQYFEEIDRLVDVVLLPEILRQLGKVDESKMIVILGSDYLIGSLKERKCPIYKYISYSRNKPISVSELKFLKKKSSSLFVVVGHIYNDNLLRYLSQSGYTYSQNLYWPSNSEVFLENFTGRYNDVFNNEVEAQKAITLFIEGAASSVHVHNSIAPLYSIVAHLKNQSLLTIGKDVSADKIIITLQSNSTLSIGDNTTFADRDMFFMSEMTKCVIENDCMFSTNVIISTERLDSSECPVEDEENKQIISDESNNGIHLSRHVWIGYEAMLLSGSDIGSSSIVGARSIIDAYYPNNCIVAGSPARIIKKDITWARQPFYTDMHQDKCIETLMNPTKFV